MPNAPRPLLPYLAGVAIVLLVIIGGWAALRPEPQVTTESTDTAATTSPADLPASPSPTATSRTAVTWSYNGTTWNASSTPPDCPTPLTLTAPADLSQATAVLYPGQTRGGNYKPHGGFRFDNAASTAIPVYLALDATLVRGSRYIEAGETQVMLDFVHSCGYWLRYDHLLTLTTDFQQLVDAELPAAKPDASQTTNFSSPTTFKAGTQIATDIGFAKTNNYAFDFGVYNLRAANTASTKPAFQQKVGSMTELSNFGVCWLDMFSAGDNALVAALPGSGTEGTTSDYCE